MKIKLTQEILNKIILEVKQEQQQKQSLLQSLRVKLRKWLDTLSPEEREIVHRTFRKKTATELLNWCGEAQDRLSGKWDNEQFNRKKEIAKLNKDK